MNNILTFLGLIRRAGRLEYGMERVISSVGIGHARLVVISRDISANTLKKLTRSIEGSGVRILTIPFTTEEIGAAVGAGNSAVLAICDRGFAKALLEKTKEKED